MDRSPWLVTLLMVSIAEVACAGANEIFLSAPGPSGPLKGTMLSSSEGHGPAVLMIPGSGPTDRDGNSPLGIKASSYRELAEGLVARGVTTVRIDKRGMFASSAAIKDANSVTIPDYVADVRSWVTVIRQRTNAPCVWLLGHSEGGLVALVAGQSVPGLCGLILVSTSGRPMGELLRDQLKSNPANAFLLNQALPAIDALEAGKRVNTSTMSPALMPLFAPQVQGFLISAFSYDPSKLLAGYAKPVLIVQGQRDIQVSVQDAQILKQADPQAKLAILPNVNHVLKQVTSDDVGANAATYADPSLPLGPGVVDAINEFLRSPPN